MKLLSIATGLTSLLVGASTLSPPPASADDVVLPTLTTVFDSLQIDQALTAVNDTLTAIERAAVDEYLNAVVDEAGNLLTEADLEVGTLIAGKIKVAVVTPDFGVDVDEITVTSSVVDGSPEFGVGTEATSAEEGEAGTAGPGMGSWPNWTTSWHASVRLKVYFDSDYLGDGLFQTFKRKMQNDGSSGANGVDYWQVSRRAVGRPQEWQGPGPNGPMRVKKLWESQRLTSASQYKAREWMLNLTKPQVGFSQCQNNVEIVVGAFTFLPKNCEDYDVWTGDIAHHRLYMDQGSTVDQGTRDLAYVTGFSIANGYAPAFTWYEFVTLRVGGNGPDMKCASDWVGYVNGTYTDECVWTSRG